MLGEISPDGGLQVDYRMKTAAANALAGQHREEGLDRVQPGSGCRRKMKCPARVTRKPGLHLWMFVGRVVVDDGFDQFAGGNGALDIVEEADELFVPVPLHAAPDHRAVEEVRAANRVVVPWRL